MNTMTTRKDFQAAMKAASGFTGRATLPILMNVLLKTCDGGLELTAYDLEMGIRQRFPAQVQTEGAVTISAKVLADILAAAPDTHITLEQQDTNEGAPLIIVADRARFEVLTLPAGDYPDIPAPLVTAWDQETDEPETEAAEGEKPKAKKVPAEPVMFDAAQLRALLNSVLYAASPDEARGVMTGVLFRLKEKRLHLAATDGHRLGVAGMDDLEGRDCEAVIPAHALNAVVRLLPTGEDQAVAMRVGESNVSFQWEGTEILTRVIAGQYPTFERVIPTEFKASATFRRDELRAAIKRAAIVAREVSNRVIFMFHGEDTKLTASAGGVGRTTEPVECLYEGEEIEIAFDARYLLDTLAAVESEGVRIDLTGPLNPAKFTSVDGEDTIHVVMPMQIV